MQYKLAGVQSELLQVDTLTVYDKFALLPRVLPFVILLTGVMIALYGGYATPSETAGLGAVLALALIASIYSVWTPRELEPILIATLRESTMRPAPSALISARTTTAAMASDFSNTGDGVVVTNVAA